MHDFAVLRATMIDTQLRTTGVNDPDVLRAVAAVPRERFVPDRAEALAYSETAVSLGGGRALMTPMVMGLLLTRLALTRDEHVLVVGAASGYAVALAARLAGRVTALEQDADLIAEADAALAATASAPGPEVAPITRAAGSLVDGWPALAPYDAMIFDGAIAELPEPLAAQLVDGGRIAAVMVGEDGTPRAGVGVRAAGRLGFDAFLEVAAPPLPGFARAAEFVF